MPIWEIKLQPLGGMLEQVDFTQWAQKIAAFEDALGDVLIVTGSLAEAEKHYRESLEIRRRLAVKDPSNAGWQRDLMYFYIKLPIYYSEFSLIKQRSGDLEDAILLSRKACKFFFISEQYERYQDELNWLNKNDANIKEFLNELGINPPVGYEDLPDM